MGDVRFPEKNEDTALMERMLSVTPIQVRKFISPFAASFMLPCKKLLAAVARNMQSHEGYFNKRLFSNVARTYEFIFICYLTPLKL
jgi:hypothetical protein